MKDQLLTNIVNHVVAHLNHVLPEPPPAHGGEAPRVRERR